MSTNSNLTFLKTPEIEIGSNFFRNTPVVVQIGDTPLVELVSNQSAGFDAQISIYHNDGTYLAKVKGSQMYLTADGEKAGLELSHPGLMTVCKLAGTVCFELRRDHAAALKLTAELYAPEGSFLKTSSVTQKADVAIGDEWILAGIGKGGLIGVKDFVVTGDPKTPGAIGLLIRPGKDLTIGLNCSVQQTWKDLSKEVAAPFLKMDPPGGVVRNVVIDYFSSKEDLEAQYGASGISNAS